MLPDAYASRYESMLERIGMRVTADDRLAAFWPMRGRLFEPGKGLMVVGRAPNGWEEDSSFRPAEMRDAQRRRQIVTNSRKHSEGTDECPMMWVKQREGDEDVYNTNRSPFWRCIRQVQEGLGLVDEARWPSYLVWSNLYKVAPYQGGNPSDRLAAAQQEDCAELLRIELETWRPARVLFLTGCNWAGPFLEHLRAAHECSDEHLVEAEGTWNGIRWVVAKHPQRKPEAQWVAEVLEAFGVAESPRSK